MASINGAWNKRIITQDVVNDITLFDLNNFANFAQVYTLGDLQFRDWLVKNKLLAKEIYCDKCQDFFVPQARKDKTIQPFIQVSNKQLS